VTKFSARQEDLVARSGEFSLYALFAQLVPKVTMIYPVKCSKIDRLTAISIRPAE
jgi:hypothetical protein